jgi:probable selenium-dependent hydroxylase accessory protein YqeC
MLTEALGIEVDDVVALVGGGGKTTTMFRLAREIVEKGEHALTTTTTRILAAQISLAPAHVVANDATCESVWAALGIYRHLLVIGDTGAEAGRTGGVSFDLFGRLRAW